MNYREIADLSLAGELLSREQCRQVLDAPEEDLLALLDAAYTVRRRYL